MNKKMKLFAATVLSTLGLIAVGVAASQTSPFKVGAETGYVCEGGYYQPITDLSANEALKAALEAAVINKNEDLLKENRLTSADSLSNYFTTNVDATIEADSKQRAYKFGDNTVVVKGGKNYGTITIKFNQPIIRVVAQVAIINSADDLDNLVYKQEIINVVNNQVTIKGEGQYKIIGKLTFRLPA